ncbi:MAG: redoxin domain-containing protein, partial [Dehalococcoidia bacterium]|nr:redoxin domain-containing protein [Dehalococcoidia bacterium]
PLIADVDKNVARLYGLLDEERGTTVRGVFIIDPKSKLKFAAYYPARIAPNVEEVLRVLRELKKV